MAITPSAAHTYLVKVRVRGSTMVVRGLGRAFLCLSVWDRVRGRVVAITPSAAHTYLVRVRV